MNSRWLGLVIFLLAIITAVSFMRAAWRGEHEPPEVADVQTIELDDDRAVQLQGRLLRNHRQAYYYQVQHGDETIQPTAFFGTQGVGAPLMQFIAYESTDGQLVGIAAEYAPHDILILHDFAADESWPAHDGNESVEQLQTRGQSLLQRLAADHPDTSLALFHAEGMRPLPPPPRDPEP